MLWRGSIPQALITFHGYYADRGTYSTKSEMPFFYKLCLFYLGDETNLKFVLPAVNMFVTYNAICDTKFKPC